MYVWLICQRLMTLCTVSPYLITDDSNDPSLASLPAWRSSNRGASSPQIFGCQTQTQDSPDNQTAVSPPALAPCIINHRQDEQAILPFRNISTAVEQAHPIDCLTDALQTKP